MSLGLDQFEAAAPALPTVAQVIPPTAPPPIPTRVCVPPVCTRVCVVPLHHLFTTQFRFVRRGVVLRTTGIGRLKRVVPFRAAEFYKIKQNNESRETSPASAADASDTACNESNPTQPFEN